jgi:hypothetical protein
MPFLFLNHRLIKDGTEIESRLIRPSEAPAVFILFVDWQVKQ